MDSGQTLKMVHFFEILIQRKIESKKKVDSLWLKAYRWLFFMTKSDAFF